MDNISARLLIQPGLLVQSHTYLKERTNGDNTRQDDPVRWRVAGVGGAASPGLQEEGYRSTYSSVVDTAVPILHAVTLGKYNLVSDAEVAERRAYDLGGAIATMLAALCSAKVDMSGCQLGYLPEVEAIAIRLDATGDIFMPIGGLDPVMIANVVKAQLLDRGYPTTDDGTVLVDMEKLLGPPEEGK